MARWSKRWAMLAGGLVSITGWLTPTWGQNPGYQPLMSQGGSPAGMPVAQMGPEALGSPSPDQFPKLGAPVPPGPPPHPLSMDYHGTPNGFSEDEYYPQPQPYILKLKGEYLLWHVGMPRLSTILATSSGNPNLVNGVGALGDAGTFSLLGPGNYDYRGISGGR